MSKQISNFNAGEPLGYFLTWTTYGTWLPGDERGWQRKRNSGIQPASKHLADSAAAKMNETKFYLNENDREIIEVTITRHCEIRIWTLHTVNARTNHVHVVLTAPGYRPETVRDQLKAWCTRKLKPNYATREHFWTEGASRRYLNKPEDLEAAIIYVSEAQDRKDFEYE